MSQQKYKVGYFMAGGFAGFFLGVSVAIAVITVVTDVDTPVANEPKCETIIVHRI